MTMPAATFDAVAPPADGLALAFGSARRRRNSKAAVSAFGGAVAIASVLSFLAPPGQTLVQEPVPPANGGTLLPGLSEQPRHGAPTPVSTSDHAAPVATASASHAAATGAADVRRSPVVRTTARTIDNGCAKNRMLACADVHTPAAGPTLHVRACPNAASVSAEYDSPSVGPTRFSISRTVQVGGGCNS